MKVRIKAEGVNLWLPIPLCLGTVAIKLGIRDQVSKEEKALMIKAFKVCKKHLKQYKGLTIVDIQTADGEIVKITI